MTRAFTPSRTAFSLIELLMVISIIAVIMCLTLLSGHAFSGASNLKSAVNQSSATLSAARTIALRDSRDTAVFFFINASGSTTLRVLERNYDTTNIGFQPIDDHPAELLPNRVQAAAPNFAGFTGTYNGMTYAGSDAEWILPIVSSTPLFNMGLMVWFGPDGITRTSDPNLPGATVYYTATSDIPPASPHTYIPPPTVGSDIPVLVMPYLALYDQQDFETYGNGTPGGDPSAWLSSGNLHAQVLMFNRYTGSLLRR